MRRTLIILACALALFMGFLGALHQPYFPQYGKGGVGAVGGSDFVFTKSAFNEMKCGGSDWRGLPRSDSQLVTCHASTVAPFSLRAFASSGLVVHFSPSRIQIYDLARLRGGYYLRGQP